MNYKNLKLDKSMYKAEGGFSRQLEKLDPTANYAGSGLSDLDAFQRQLKRFDIKVNGAYSDTISKFFATTDSAALFPEYISRSVSAGAEQKNIIEQIIASKSIIDSLDYRSITSTLTDKNNPVLSEGDTIPEVSIKLNDTLVSLKKRGRMLCASYEAIKHQRADVFGVALKQIGYSLAKNQMQDAVDMLVNGNGTIAAADVTTVTGSVSYSDLVDLWASFGDFEMNTLLVSPNMIKEIISLPEFIDSTTGDNFTSDGTVTTPFGAKLIKSPAVADGIIVALDSRFALEMVTTGDMQVEYDKLIDTQLERAAVTTTYGFSKLFTDAVKVIEVV